MENDNLYTNAPRLVTLVECLQSKTKTKEAYDALEEVLNIIYDDPWREIK